MNKLNSTNEFVVGKYDIGYVDSNFKDRFGDTDFEQRALGNFQTLPRYMTGVEIESELKPGVCELGDVLAFLKNPPGDTKDGRYNLFLVGGFVVGVVWRSYDRFWCVDAWLRGGDWGTDDRVFSPANSRPLNSDSRALEPFDPRSEIENKSEKTINGCWLWKGPLSEGYGHITFKGKRYGAHRFMYILAKGEIPEGLQIDHLCRNRSCVNPAHLEAVTQKENLLRGESFSAINAKKMFCPKGHSLDEKIAYIEPGRYHRHCKICTRVRQRNYYRKKKGLPLSDEDRVKDSLYKGRNPKLRGKIGKKVKKPAKRKR